MLSTSPFVSVMCQNGSASFARKKSVCFAVSTLMMETNTQSSSSKTKQNSNTRHIPDFSHHCPSLFLAVAAGRFIILWISPMTAPLKKHRKTIYHIALPYHHSILKRQLKMRLCSINRRLLILASAEVCFLDNAAEISLISRMRCIQRSEFRDQTRRGRQTCSTPGLPLAVLPCY